MPRPAVFGAFVRRDWRIARSYRFPFILNVVGSTLIILPMFELSKLIPVSEAVQDPQLRHGYFAFALVGSMALFSGTGALRAFATGLREQQTSGTLEALLATPLSPSTIIVGTALYEVVVGTLVMLAVLAVGVGLGVRPDWALLPVGASVAALIGLLLAFVALGVVVSSFTLVFKRGNALVALISSGLLFLGDIWYPNSTLPKALSVVANALPITWDVEALRDSLLFGQVDALRLIGGVGFGLLGVIVALGLFRLAVDHVRRHGALGQY